MFDTVVRHDARVRGPRVPHRPHQRRASFVSMQVSSNGAGRADRACSRSWSRSAAASRRAEDAHVAPPTATAARPRTSTPPPTTRPSSATTAQWLRGRAAADGRRDRGRGRPAICRKLREIRGGDAVVCGIHGIEDRPRVPGARSARLRVHDQRDLVGAAGRGRRRPDRGDDARRRKRAGEPDRVRRRPGRRPHRRRRVLLRSDRGAATSTCCSPATRSPSTTSSRRSTARRSASTSESGRAIEGGHRHHMRAINAIYRAGGLRAAVEQRRPEVRRDVRVHRTTSTTCSPAASATTGRCPTR